MPILWRLPKVKYISLFSQVYFLIFSTCSFCISTNFYCTLRVVCKKSRQYVKKLKIRNNNAFEQAAVYKL